jgi:transposase-like protein
MKRTRRKFSAAFKAKVVLEALKEQMTAQELSSKYAVHANQISTWKTEFISNAPAVFEGKKQKETEGVDTEKLYKTIGQQKVEIDFLKTVLGK